MFWSQSLVTVIENKKSGDFFKKFNFLIVSTSVTFVISRFTSLTLQPVFFFLLLFFFFFLFLFFMCSRYSLVATGSVVPVSL